MADGEPEFSDVLIIGAGPTGLSLAIALQQAGIAHLLIDKLASGQNTSRAVISFVSPLIFPRAWTIPSVT